MATVLITGGTGLVGKHLVDKLTNKGYEVIIFTRQAKKSRQPNVRYAVWDVKAGKLDEDAIAAADHIIHLAGASVAEKRWTKKRKQEIVESRTESAALLVKALKEVSNRVRSVISASAIGWYGPDTQKSRENGFAESDPPNRHFLGETCRLWEGSIQPVKNLGKRLVKFRIGIVMAKEGGALKEFSKPLQFGLATILGNGEQVISWIHVDDLCSMFLYALENEAMEGVYNAVAPNPVSNKELVLTLAKKMRGSVYIPIHVPSFALKIALGEMSIEVLKSATVSSKKIESTGFRFQYPTITEALC